MNRLDWLKAIRRGLSANAAIAIGAFTTYLFSEGIISAAAIAVLFFCFTPFPYEVRKAVAITAFAPISSASPAFVADLKGDVELVGFASTVSIVISLLLMPLLFALI